MQLSVAFRRQEAINQCAEEAELMFKFRVQSLVGTKDPDTLR